MVRSLSVMRMHSRDLTRIWLSLLLPWQTTVGIAALFLDRGVAQVLPARQGHARGLLGHAGEHRIVEAQSGWCRTLLGPVRRVQAGRSVDHGLLSEEEPFPSAACRASDFASGS